MTNTEDIKCQMSGYIANSEQKVAIAHIQYLLKEIELRDRQIEKLTPPTDHEINYRRRREIEDAIYFRENGNMGML